MTTQIIDINEMVQQLGRGIRRIRERRGISRLELAKDVTVFNTVSNLEHGTASTRIDFVLAFCVKLGTTVEEAIKIGQEPDPAQPEPKFHVSLEGRINRLRKRAERQAKTRPASAPQEPCSRPLPLAQ